MPKFTIYLVKDGFDFSERYRIENNEVNVNNKSIFNDGVTTSNNSVINKYLFDRKIDRKLIYKSKSMNEVYYRETNSDNPWWLDYWSLPEQLQNKSTDLIILLSIKENKVIITHGHGRFLINPLAIVYDFGLKTALNTIDENKIKSADLFTPSEIALRTRKQSGKNTKIDEYDINIYNSLLKSIRGIVKTEYEDYFKNIDGADSIKFSFSEDKNELIKIIDDLITQYASNSYQKKGFEWIDNFRIVKDKGIISELDKVLVDEINKKNEEIILSFPEVLDSNNPIYYRYKGIEGVNRLSRYPELDIEDQYYSFLSKTTKATTIDDIKKQQIVSFDMNLEKDIYSQKVYQCLYYDFNYKSKKYFIENGTWYKVNEKFKNDTETNFNNLVSGSRNISFQYNNSEVSHKAVKEKSHKEYVFNRLLTEEFSKQYQAELLDTELTDRIEVCDVLCQFPDSKILFHNKYKYNSGALSHLFSQGYVSALSISDEKFRKKANLKIKNSVLKFEEDDSFERKKHTVAYGIIGKKNKSGIITVPLFSMINLNMFIKNITTLGYKTEIVFFEVI